MNPFIAQFPMLPMDVLIVEAVYFLLVFVICMLIYWKTREIYSLSQHRGIFHFRNVFLFFGFAYFFRLLHMLTILGIQLTSWLPQKGMSLLIIFLVSYASTVAIISLCSAFLVHIRKKDFRYGSFVPHLISFLIAVLVFATSNIRYLYWIQAIIILSATLAFLLFSRAQTKNQWKNRIHSLVIAGLWFFTVLIFGLRHITLSLRALLYAVSVAAFVALLYRVHTRLTDGKKKRSS